MLAALGVYFINGMFHDITIVPTANMTLFFLAGVTGGLQIATHTADNRKAHSTHRFKTPSDDRSPMTAPEFHSA